MYGTLKRLYNLGLLTIDKISESTRYGWITPEQYKDITGQDYIVAEQE